MDRFINDKNLDRLRRLASVVTSEAERKTLLGLLAKEKATFVELQKAGSARVNSGLKTLPWGPQRGCRSVRLDPPSESSITGGPLAPS